MLVLKLPLKLCVVRVAARRNHEGGVEGPTGLGVVHRMGGALARAGLPTPAEGVDSVAVRCLPAATGGCLVSGLTVGVSRDGN